MTDTKVPEEDVVEPTSDRPLEPAQGSAPTRKLYFINEIVEWLLTKYIWTGCTDIALRDQIMSNANELIRQMIRKQGLHTIYPGQDESSFGDLIQVAWCQLERTLYKYRSRAHCRTCFNPDRPSDSLLYAPAELEYGIKTMEEIIEVHKKCPKCQTKLTASPMIEPAQNMYGGSTTILYRGMSKVFNMWSQVSRTVILAHIKKEGRDRKNSPLYINHLGTKHKPVSGSVDRLIAELRELWRYHLEYQAIIDAFEWIIMHDDRPHDGMIGKLVDKSGMSRIVVANFMHLTKLRSSELSDSNLNRRRVDFRIDNNNHSGGDSEDE